MRAVRHGLLAGLLAGGLVISLLFVDEGPGNQLARVAQAVSLTGGSTGRWLVAGLVLVLGGLTGIGFGAMLRHRPVSQRQSLLLGLAFGVGWWVLVLVSEAATHRFSLDSYPLLLSLVLCLLYGLMLGGVYTALHQHLS